MKQYRCLDTNEIWTLEEIRDEYEADYELAERYDSFEDYMDYLLDLGRQKIGGLVEVE